MSPCGGGRGGEGRRGVAVLPRCLTTTTPPASPPCVSCGARWQPARSGWPHAAGSEQVPAAASEGRRKESKKEREKEKEKERERECYQVNFDWQH